MFVLSKFLFVQRPRHKQCRLLGGTPLKPVIMFSMVLSVKPEIVDYGYGCPAVCYEVAPAALRQVSLVATVLSPDGPVGLTRFLLEVALSTLAVVEVLVGT